MGLNGNLVPVIQGFCLSLNFKYEVRGDVAQPFQANETHENSPKRPMITAQLLLARLLRLFPLTRSMLMLHRLDCR